MGPTCGLSFHSVFIGGAILTVVIGGAILAVIGGAILAVIGGAILVVVIGGAILAVIGGAILAVVIGGAILAVVIGGAILAVVLFAPRVLVWQQKRSNKNLCAGLGWRSFGSSCEPLRNSAQIGTTLGYSPAWQH
jgi:hypothetical protein